MIPQVAKIWLTRIFDFWEFNRKLKCAQIINYYQTWNKKAPKVATLFRTSNPTIKLIMKSISTQKKVTY